jgi:hypothetical protein
MSLRNRYVKADFWSDAKLFRFSDTEKLLYIGLWAEADDHGWLRWDPEQIAIDLRRGIPLDDGIRDVERAGAAFAAKGRLRILECGHAVIPTFPKHQTRIASSNRTRTYLAEHERECVKLHRAPPSSTELHGAPPTGRRVTAPSSLERHGAPPSSTTRGGKGRGGEEREKLGSVDSEVLTAHAASTEEEDMPDEFMADHLRRVQRPITEDEAVVSLKELVLNGKSQAVKDRAQRTLEKHYQLKVNAEGELEVVP